MKTNQSFSSYNHSFKSRNHNHSLSKTHSLNNITKKSTNFTKNFIIPKDLNQFKHLLSTSSTTPSDLDWLFKLRSYDSASKLLNNKSDSNTIVNPPSFYDEDLAKHRKKVKQRVVYSSEPFYRSQNSFSLYHLVNKGKVNSTQLNFQSTLRDIKHNPSTHYNWNNLPYNTSSIQKHFPFLPPLNAKSKEKYKKIDNYLLKKYKVLVQKIKYGKDTIHKKIVKEDNVYIPIDSSEHLIMGKYNPKYDNKNVSEIRHLMKHSNSTAKFEIGLREGFEMTTRNFNNKIRQKNVEESAFNKKNPMHRFH